MESKIFKISKVLILIPYVKLAVMVLLVLLTLISGLFSQVDLSAVTLYFFIILFTPIPCLILSVIGLILIIILKNKNTIKSNKWIIIGLISVLLAILLVLWDKICLDAMMSV